MELGFAIRELFAEKPQANLEQRADLLNREIDFKKSTLRKIKNAKIKSESDIMKLAVLLGSYIGKELDNEDLDPARAMFLKGVIIPLDNMVYLPLETKLKTLSKGSEEWKQFHTNYKNDEVIQSNVTMYLGRLNNFANAIKDQKLQDAMVRPIARYEYKFGSGKLLGRNMERFREQYNLYIPSAYLTDGYTTEDHLKRVVKRESLRVYVPTLIGYSMIGIGGTILFVNLFKRKGK